MPLEKAARLGCAGLTGLGTVRRAAKVQLGETVAVIGCGGVGLNVVQGALSGDLQAGDPGRFQPTDQLGVCPNRR